MISVIFYNFILLSSTLFIWLSEKGRTGFDRTFLLSIAFLLVFIPAAIRYDIGTDYLSYVNIFENPSILENYKLKEPGFYFINWLLKISGLHFQWVFVIFAFIFTAVAFKTYPRKNAWLLHFLFFSMLWFSSFNIMRQTTALVWCFLAVFYFFKDRHFWFIGLTLIGFTFHQSAIFILLTGLLSLIPLRSDLKARFLPMAFIIGIIFTYLFMELVLGYIEHLLILLNLTKYANYFHSSHFIVRDYGSGLGVLAKVLFSAYIIWNTKYFLQLNKRYWLVILLTFIYAIGTILANSIVIFGRMADTFSIAPIIGAYILMQIPNNRRLNKLILILFLIFLFMSFLKSSFGISTSYSNPKLVPYQFIFLI